MKNKGFLFLSSFVLIFLLMSSTIFATSKDKCTHTVYSTNDTSTYHYYYCSVCGKCNSRETHSTSWTTRYDDTYHNAYCSCDKYLGLQTHSASPQSLYDGETVRGVSYSGKEMLDTYHKMVCTFCGEKTGVEKHAWTGGNTSPHQCGGCSYFHSKKDDATRGRHYFNIEKIRKAGNVTFCEVCNQYLRLTYPSDSTLSKLPKKEEYTMVGNPTPMKEVTLDTDQKIKCNFMPINEERRNNNVR